MQLSYARVRSVMTADRFLRYGSLACRLTLPAVRISYQYWLVGSGIGLRRRSAGASALTGLRDRCRAVRESPSRRGAGAGAVPRRAEDAAGGRRRPVAQRRDYAPGGVAAGGPIRGFHSGIAGRLQRRADRGRRPRRTPRLRGRAGADVRPAAGRGRRGRQRGGGARRLRFRPLAVDRQRDGRAALSRPLGSSRLGGDDLRVAHLVGQCRRRSGSWPRRKWNYGE